MLIIGLTGGIGSGKSTVAGILAKMGAPVLDADLVGHEVYEPGSPAYTEMIDAFGEQILGTGGAIDRKRLGAIVFADRDALRRLNAIVHPRIAGRIKEKIREIRMRGEASPVIVEAAILIEAGWHEFVDEVWLVESAHEQVTHRLERDRAMDSTQIERRIRAQLSPEERRRHATLIIENNGTFEDLRATVARVWREAQQRTGAGVPLAPMRRL